MNKGVHAPGARPLDAVGRARRAKAVERLPIAAVGACLVLAARGHGRIAAWLGGLACVGYAVNLRRARRAGFSEMEEQVRRMERLRPDVLAHFYMTAVKSMETELVEFPPYDQHKHQLRYALVVQLAEGHMPDGGTIVDVGCAGASVLDHVRSHRDVRAVGFDLSPQGPLERLGRADPPILAQAQVEAMPLADEVADVVIFGEVIEHLIDPYPALREVSRITRAGGVVILTTNNASEMPLVSPLRHPLTWCERLLGWWKPSVLSFRNLTWPDPVWLWDPSDPLPREGPTYAPHIHYSASELRSLAMLAGFEVEEHGSFEYPAPNSPLAEWMRGLTIRSPRFGRAASGVAEAVASRIPGVRLLGTHQYLLLRKRAKAAPAAPIAPWQPGHSAASMPS